MGICGEIFGFGLNARPRDRTGSFIAVNPAAGPPVGQETGRRDGNATITASRLRAATYQVLSVRRARRAVRQPLTGRLATARHGAQHARPFRQNRLGIKQRAEHASADHSSPRQAAAR